MSDIKEAQSGERVTNEPNIAKKGLKGSELYRAHWAKEFEENKENKEGI